MSFPFLITVTPSNLASVLHLLESQMHISPLWFKNIYSSLVIPPTLPSPVLTSHHSFEYPSVSLAGVISIFSPLTPSITIQGLDNFYLNLEKTKTKTRFLYPIYCLFSQLLYHLSLLLIFKLTDCGHYVESISLAFTSCFHWAFLSTWPLMTSSYLMLRISSYLLFLIQLQWHFFLLFLVYHLSFFIKRFQSAHVDRLSLTIITDNYIFRKQPLYFLPSCSSLLKIYPLVIFRSFKNLPFYHLSPSLY